jgi:hypothetical protein
MSEKTGTRRQLGKPYEIHQQHCKFQRSTPKLLFCCQNQWQSLSDKVTLLELNELFEIYRKITQSPYILTVCLWSLLLKILYQSVHFRFYQIDSYQLERQLLLSLYNRLVNYRWAIEIIIKTNCKRFGSICTSSSYCAFRESRTHVVVSRNTEY